MLGRKWLAAVALAVVGGALLYAYGSYSRGRVRRQLLARLSELEGMCLERRSVGYDVAEVERLLAEARAAVGRGSFEEAERLLEEASRALEEAPRVEEAGRLSRVRVAVLYERVTDTCRVFGRSLDDIVAVLKETGAEFVFRGFWRWSPCPEYCSQLSGRARELCEERGYSYRHLEEAIARIKSELPDVIFCGAIPAQIIQRRAVWDPVTHEVIRYPETWEMALDPGKWGIDFSKERLQCEFGKSHFWVDPSMDCSEYSPEKAAAYFPDITNERFQKLLLSWAMKQIDCGADAIWIDMLFKQASMLAKITGDVYHPAVKESYEAACKIVDEIHRYGRLKGRYIYVGSWATAVRFPYPPPSLDFVTLSPSTKEVLSMKLNEEKWSRWLTQIREKLGDVPVFVFIDWASTSRTPLGAFSQNLTPEEQCMFIRMADEFFTKMGAVFTYPVHGGWMGNDAQVLSFGASRVYDSLAPEFQTYQTIRELAQSKRRS